MKKLNSIIINFGLQIYWIFQHQHMVHHRLHIHHSVHLIHPIHPHHFCLHHRHLHHMEHQVSVHRVHRAHQVCTVLRAKRFTSSNHETHYLTNIFHLIVINPFHRLIPHRKFRKYLRKFHFKCKQKWRTNFCLYNWKCKSLQNSKKKIMRNSLFIILSLSFVFLEEKK